MTESCWFMLEIWRIVSQALLVAGLVVSISLSNVYKDCTMNDDLLLLLS